MLIASHMHLQHQNPQALLLISLGLLQNGGSEDELTQCLVQLGNLVNVTATDLETRDTLVTTDAIGLSLAALEQIQTASSFDKDESLYSLYLRLLRGVVLLVRNLVPGSTSALDARRVLPAILAYLSEVPTTNPLYYRVLGAYAELLANYATKYGSSLGLDVLSFTTAFKNDTFNAVAMTNESSLIVPFNLFLSRAFSDYDSVSTLLSDPGCLPLVDYLSRSDISTNQELLLLMEVIICHEKFHSWIISHVESDPKILLLEPACLTATSKDDWDNALCITILNWASDIVKYFSPKAVDILNSRIYDVSLLEYLHLVVVKALDVLADFGKYNCAQQFFFDYDILETVIPLFRAVYESVKVKTAKDSRSTGAIASKEFPVVSSLIIEILAFACHSSFQAQEKIRELHGLELVLSSCVIDDDNPFMKERAILCLKFLLEKNSLNQKFVAELEAHQVADNTALEEAGYQVDLVGGKLEVKKKET